MRRLFSVAILLVSATLSLANIPTHSDYNNSYNTYAKRYNILEREDGIFYEGTEYLITDKTRVYLNGEPIEYDKLPTNTISVEHLKFSNITKRVIFIFYKSDIEE
jgi:hypothetical protein